MAEGTQLKILLISSEVAPYAKSGGLGDVAGSLPKALKQLGADVRVVVPKYKSIKTEYFQDIKFLGAFDTNLSWRRQKAGILLKEGEVPTYFIENDFYFGRDGFYGYGDDNERFAFFCKAAVEMMPFIDFYPDVLHLNDWQSGLCAVYLKEKYKNFLCFSNMKVLFTIHNLQYQGNFGGETLEMLDVPRYCYENGSIEYYGNINYMKAGLSYADIISTVSKTYMQEIQTPQYGYGMDGVLRSRKEDLRGILNGIDYTVNNPKTDKRIWCPYDRDSLEKKKENKKKLQELLGLEKKDVPIISIVSRLADQKGLDIIAKVLEEIMREEIEFVVLGTGEDRYEYMFRGFAQRYPGRFSANILFDDTLAQRIYAGSDIFLMPSLFEPCGLGQIISLRYGTIPVVRKTGGLADTIFHYDTYTKKGNGFVFEDYNAEGLLWGLKEALRVYRMGPEEWNKVVRNAMDCDYSWNHSAREYYDLYSQMAGK